jgi:hypothetical protein
MRIFLYIASVLLIYSCTPCSNLDCPPPNTEGWFRVLNATNGKDLVFGADKRYDKKQVKFYGLNGSDTSFLEYKPEQYRGQGYDSVLFVYFKPAFETVYMRLNDVDTDTLHITYKTVSGRCCGTITSVKEFTYNNKLKINGTYGIMHLNK